MKSTRPNTMEQGLTPREWERLISTWILNPPTLAEPPTLEQGVAAATIAAGRKRYRPLSNEIMRNALRAASYLRSRQQEPNA